MPDASISPYFSRKPLPIPYRLHFAAEGAACVLATDAGDQRETECFLRPDKKALAGMLVCCLRSNGEKGNVTVSCTAEGLESATLTFDCI